jgi:peptide/nickel transport system substrate-binding protein
MGRLRVRLGSARLKAGFAVVVLALAMTLTPSGASAGTLDAAQPSGVRGNVTVVGDFNLATVDPGSPSEATGSGSIYYYAIYDGLFTFSDTSQLQADLATSWSLSDGGLLATVNLRSGVTFQDATPFDAAAVKWNLDRDSDPANACACLESLSDIKSVAAPSPTKVEITLKTPDPSFFTVLASSSGNFIASPTAFKKEGAATFGLKPVGAGPFQVQSLVANGKLILTRYPGYWDASAVHLKSITVVVDSESATQYDALEAGTAQLMMFADPTSEQQAIKDNSYRLITQPATAWTAIQFNTLTAPFNSLAARQAVAAAIDPTALNKTLYYGTNVVSNSIFGQGEDIEIGSHVPGGPSFNQPTTAASLVKANPPISFTMDSLDSPINMQVLTAIQAELNHVGIKMQISTYPRSSYLPVLEGGQFQAFFSGDSGQIDPSAYAGAFFTPGGEFQKGLNDQKLASMVAAAAAATTTTGRVDAYRQMMSYVNKQLYFLPLWTTPTFDIATKTLGGVAVGPSVSLNRAYLGTAKSTHS